MNNTEFMLTTFTIEASFDASYDRPSPRNLRHYHLSPSFLPHTKAKKVSLNNFNLPLPAVPPTPAAAKFPLNFFRFCKAGRPIFLPIYIA